jgi:hypothetical protein
MSEFKLNSKQERASLLNRTMKLFGVIMVMVYVAIGVALISNMEGILNVPSPFSMPIGALLIFYGCYRGFRLYQDYFKN